METKPNLNCEVQILHGDCLELLGGIPDGHCDAVVTDPPYLIGAVSSGDARSKAGSWTDLMNASFWYKEWMWKCWQKLKPTGFLVTFTNWRSLPMLMKACADNKMRTSNLAVWDKDWIGPAGDFQLRPSHEMILFCAKQEAKIENRSQPDVFRHKWMACHSGVSGHPAEKPVPLLKELIELTSKPEGVVLDPFAGSGSTGVAALQTGRRFIGIEGDDKWHPKAVERVQAHEAKAAS